MLLHSIGSSTDFLHGPPEPGCRARNASHPQPSSELEVLRVSRLQWWYSPQCRHAVGCPCILVLPHWSGLSTGCLRRALRPPQCAPRTHRPCVEVGALLGRLARRRRRRRACRCRRRRRRACRRRRQACRRHYPSLCGAGRPPLTGRTTTSRWTPPPASPLVRCNGTRRLLSMLLSRFGGRLQARRLRRREPLCITCRQVSASSYVILE